MLLLFIVFPGVLLSPAVIDIFLLISIQAASRKSNNDKCHII